MGRRRPNLPPLLLAAATGLAASGALWFLPALCAAQDTPAAQATGAGAAQAADAGRDTRAIYQVSSREAMMVGRFDDGPTIATLKKHGDFGLGIFDGFDGELIVVDGKVYQARVDATPAVPDESMRTPFALVTFFKPSQTLAVDHKTNLAGLEQLIVAAMPSRKIYSAVRLTGHFAAIKSRNVPVQNRPYPSLPQVLEHERVGNLRDVDATMVGFWAPATMAEMSGGGLHLHFLTADGKHGGHVLDCEFEQVKVEVEPIRHIEIVLVDH